MNLLPDAAARTADGHLCLGGCDTLELVRQYGTPLYVYDRVTLRNAARCYRDALHTSYHGPSTVAYASKAYLCTALAHFWAQQGLALDVVGPGELETALYASFPAKRIHLHGNNKPPALLARAMEAGIGRIVIDGDSDFEQIEALSPSRPVQAWLRLSPAIDAHTHDHIKTGLLDSKFGFPIATGEAEQAVERALHSSVIELIGLHAHIGSQVLAPAPLVACAEALIDFAIRARDRHGWTAAEISPGGGWGVPYLPGQPDPPPKAFIAPLCASLTARCQAHALPMPHLILEPGRSLVARAGVALYSVGGRKSIPRQRTYVALDGGLADNPRPALYGARYTALLAGPGHHRVDAEADDPDEPVTLCGPFCESGDILARDVRLPRLHRGDVVAIPISGAYQLSMASAYNGFPRPAVIWVEDGEAALIQRRERVADLLSRDVWVARDATRRE